MPSVQSNVSPSRLFMMNPSHSYKWTIPVQWNSLNTSNGGIILLDKGLTGTSMESCFLDQINLINIII